MNHALTPEEVAFIASTCIDVANDDRPTLAEIATSAGVVVQQGADALVLFEDHCFVPSRNDVWTARGVAGCVLLRLGCYSERSATALAAELLRRGRPAGENNP